MTFHSAEMFLYAILLFAFHSAPRNLLGFLTGTISYWYEADGFVRQYYVCGGDFRSSNGVVRADVLQSSIFGLLQLTFVCCLWARLIIGLILGFISVLRTC